MSESTPLSFFRILNPHTYYKEGDKTSDGFGCVGASNRIYYDQRLHRAAYDKANYGYTLTPEQENRSALTVMFEDFAKMTQNLNEDGKSYIADSQMKDYGFFEKEGNNIYRSDEALESTRDNRRNGFQSGEFTQHDIFMNDLYVQEIEHIHQLEYEFNKEHPGEKFLVRSYDDVIFGLRYADANDDVYLAALNYAKADFGAIEAAYDILQKQNGNKKYEPSGELNENEILSYDQFTDASMDLIKYDIDGNNDTFTAEEYATYILYADGLDEHGNFDPSRIDGLMTKDEVKRINKVFEKLNTNPDTYYEKKEIMAELKSIHDELVQKSQAKEKENQAKAEEEEKNKTFLQKLCAFFGL